MLKLIKPAAYILVSVFLVLACGIDISDDIANLSSDGRLAGPGEYPQTLRLEGSLGAVCTGQLIENNIILTSAHCIVSIQSKWDPIFSKTQRGVLLGSYQTYELQVNDLNVYYNDQLVGQSGGIKIHPERAAFLNDFLDRFSAKDGQHGPGKFGMDDLHFFDGLEELYQLVLPVSAHNDLALIQLTRTEESKNLAIPITKISNNRAREGQRVIFAGYGAQFQHGPIDNRKRIGKNTVEKVYSNHFTMQASYQANNPLDAGVYQGDSGALIYDNATGQGLGIVTSTVLNEEDGKTTTTAFITDLHHESIKNFICKTLPSVCY